MLAANNFGKEGEHAVSFLFVLGSSVLVTFFVYLAVAVLVVLMLIPVATVHFINFNLRYI